MPRLPQNLHAVASAHSRANAICEKHATRHVWSAAPATKNWIGHVQSAAPATKNDKHVVKTLQKYCACHEKRFSIRCQTRQHVTKCHAGHAKRRLKTRNTSKNDDSCETSLESTANFPSNGLLRPCHKVLRLPRKMSRMLWKRRKSIAPATKNDCQRTFAQTVACVRLRPVGYVGKRRPANTPQPPDPQSVKREPFATHSGKTELGPRMLTNFRKRFLNKKLAESHLLRTRMTFGWLVNIRICESESAIYVWLVVSTPLKNMNVSWDYEIPYIWKIIQSCSSHHQPDVMFPKHPQPPIRHLGMISTNFSWRVTIGSGHLWTSHLRGECRSSTDVSQLAVQRTESWHLEDVSYHVISRWKMKGKKNGHQHIWPQFFHYSWTLGLQLPEFSATAQTS